MKSRFAHAAALAATVGLAASLPAEIIVYSGTDTATLTGRPPIFRTLTDDATIAVTVATTVALPATSLFSPTTNSGRFTKVPASIDGVTLAIGHLVLVRNQANAAQNGIYRVASIATTTTVPIWDRWANFNEASEMAPDVRVRVSAGTANAGRIFDKVTATVIVNTDPIAFVLDAAAAAVVAVSSGPLAPNVAPLTPTLFNPTGGTAGKGAFTNAPTVLDGITLAINHLVLVKNQDTATIPAPEQNGIYRVTASKTWTRWGEFDDVSPSEIALGFKVQVISGFSSCGLTFETTAVPTTINTAGQPITFTAVTPSDIRKQDLVAISAPVTVPIKHEFYLLRDLTTGGTAVIFFNSLSSGQAIASRPYIWQYPPFERMAFLSRTLGNVTVRNPADTAKSGEGYFVDIDYSDSQNAGFIFPYVVQDSTSPPFADTSVPRLLSPYDDNGRVETFHGAFNRNKISPTATTSQEFETFIPGPGLGLGLPESANFPGLSALDTRALTVVKPLTTKPAFSVPVGTLFTTKYSGFAYGYFSPTDFTTVDPTNAITGRTATTPTLPTVGGASSDSPTTRSVTQFADAYVTGTLTMRLSPALSDLTVGLTGGNATLQKAMEIVTGNLRSRLFTPVKDTVTFPNELNDVYYNNMTDADFNNLLP